MLPDLLRQATSYVAAAVAAFAVTVRRASASAVAAAAAAALNEFVKTVQLVLRTGRSCVIGKCCLDYERSIQLHS